MTDTMADDSERPRRGMTFPFSLTLLLFAAVLADRYLGGPGFVASAAWRQQPYILQSIVVVAFLLWLWVLAAARRRAVKFEGPILNSRGNNGALQPILATVFLVITTNLAWSEALPRWLNFIVADDVTSVQFAVVGDVVPTNRCIRVPVRSEIFGDVELCLPPALAGELPATPGNVLTVRGASSWFGIEPDRYELTNEPLIAPELVIGSPPAEEDAGILSVEELLEALEPPESAGKITRPPRTEQRR